MSYAKIRRDAQRVAKEREARIQAARRAETEKMNEIAARFIPVTDDDQVCLMITYKWTRMYHDTTRGDCEDCDCEDCEGGYPPEKVPRFVVKDYTHVKFAKCTLNPDDVTPDGVVIQNENTRWMFEWTFRPEEVEDVAEMCTHQRLTNKNVSANVIMNMKCMVKNA